VEAGNPFVIADEAVTVTEIEGDRASRTTFPFASMNAEMVIPLDPALVLALRPNEELLDEIAHDDARARARSLWSRSRRNSGGRWCGRSGRRRRPRSMRSISAPTRTQSGAYTPAMRRHLRRCTTSQLVEAERVATLRPQDPDLAVVHERRF
jgi:hypothetical protein